MTYSREKRKELADNALKLMMVDLGGGAIDGVFELHKPPYDAIDEPTWEDLNQRGLITRDYTIGGKFCSLTGEGWLAGLELVGMLESTPTKEKVGKLMAALKKEVLGRQQKGFQYTEVIANSAGLPLDFVYNVIESNYIERVLERRGAQFPERYKKGQAIEIPVDFGIPL